MATIDELVKSGNYFLFRGKKYKFCSFIPEPTIEMINEDGEIFSFGINGEIKDEFIKVTYQSQSTGAPQGMPQWGGV